MIKTVTCAQMKELDGKTFSQYHIPSIVLMERAALFVSDFIRKTWSDTTNEKILVVCGSGNNGGDGIAIARLLHLAGYHASFYLAGDKEKMTEQTLTQYQAAKSYQVPEVSDINDLSCTILVDAVFGVGLKRDISGNYKEVIMSMNSRDAVKIAVDIPSGINGDNGSVMGVAFHADYTITFAMQKQGLCLYPGNSYAGEITVADIGIYDIEDSVCKYELEPSDLDRIPQRTPYGNKGTFGKILILAGSDGMSGAAYLCASAALNAGGGMVMIHTPECNRSVLQTLIPEAMVTTSFQTEDFDRLYDWCDCIVIGPGLSTTLEASDHIFEYLKRNEKTKKPMIIDADGLNLLSKNEIWYSYLGNHVIVTPHVGEMARLSGLGIDQIKSDLLGVSEAYAAEHKMTCVLKDAVTVVSGHGMDRGSQRACTYINTKINAGLATAGSGDVLCGTIAGVLGCHLYSGVKSEQLALIAALGVLLHSCGGVVAQKQVGERSMIARDILKGIQCCLNSKTV